jgi:hypothetical protein
VRKKIIVSFCLFLLLFFSCFLAIAANDSSCIQCHTNDSLMKSLHKPLPMPISEGEG